MRHWISLKMALAHIRANFRRLVLSAAAVALGVGLVVAVLLMNSAVLASFSDSIDNLAGRSHLTVSAGDDASFPEKLAEEARGVSGVKLVVPLVSAVAFPDDGSGRLLTVFGIDLTNDAAVRTYHSGARPQDVVQDFVLFLSQPDSIVLSRDFAIENGLKVDDKLSLVTPNGVKPFTIRGLIEPEGLARTFGGRLVIMDLYSAERAFTADGLVSQLDIVLTDPSATDRVKQELAAVLPPGIRVQEPAARKSVVRQTVKGIQAMLLAFALLSVLAGFLICYGRLSAVFDARMWEIGVLRSIGLRQSVVAVELLKEALILGTVGSVAGIPLGLFLARYGLPLVEATITATYRLPLFGARPDVQGSAILSGLAVGVAATALAALGPSLRLARQPPVAAVSLRGREASLLSNRATWIAPAVLGFVIVALIGLQKLTDYTAIGQVTTLLIAVATCALAVPFVRLSSAVVREIAHSVFGATGKLAVQHIQRNPDRSALTVATMGLGIGVVLFLGLLGHSFETTVVSLFSDSLRADLIVSSQLQAASYRSAAIGEDVISSILHVPGVVAASGEQTKDQQQGADSVVLKSFDRSAFTTTVYKWPLEHGALPGALASVADGRAVLVTRAYAYQTKRKVGEMLQLDTPSGPREFVIAAVATGQMENAIILSRDVYRSLWNDRDVYLIHVGVDPSRNVQDVKTAIERTVGESHRLKVRSGPELVTHLKNEAHKAFIVFYFLDVVILILVVISIGDTLATSVMDRIREFGVMRAVGMTRTAVSKVVLIEGGALAAFGLMLAVLTGLSLGVFWVTIQFPAMLGWGLDLHVPYEFGIATSGLAMLLVLLGSILPSLRAAKLSVVQALRFE